MRLFPKKVIEAAYASNKEKNISIQDMVVFFRQLWGKFTFYVLATSVIGLFLGSVFFNKVIELEIINNWVSIVLGLVALIIGIISLFLSFYNLDEANKTNKETVDIIRNMQNDITKELNEVRKDIEKKIDAYNKETRDMFNGATYRESTRNSFQQPQGNNIWEEF